MVAMCVGVLVPLAFADEDEKAPVAVTGQTQCWDTHIAQIDCSGTGQDGDIQAGVPFPTPRFVDHRNGTVTDRLTGLIWLKNAHCFGDVPWADALTDANTLAHGSCGLTDHSKSRDWRLPNIKELQSLIDFEFATPALSNARGTAQWAEGDAFSNVQEACYWSSTTALPLTSAFEFGFAKCVFLIDGTTTATTKNGTLPIWPVRGGKVRERERRQDPSTLGQR
jgi:hypothetical protein